jgi:hypothetical protein
MKKLINVFFAVFLGAVAVIGQPLYGKQRQTKSVEASIKRVDKEMSLLDQIIEQANIVVDGTDQKARSQAKKELIRLMKNKDLDVKIKDVIKDDIEVIKNPKTKREQHEARIRLLNTYAKINTQANVVEAIAEATAMVKNASPEELDAVIAQAKQKIEAAEQEQQGIMARWYAKAKRMVTAPVNYVFGEESSYAKTAFYATVGLAILAAGGYAAYRYSGAVVENDALKQNKIDDMRNVIDSMRDNMNQIQRERMPLEEEKNYWKTMQILADEGKRQALSSEESKKAKEVIDQLSRLYSQEDDLKHSLSESGVDIDKASGLVERAKYDYYMNPEAKNKQNSYKAMYEQEVNDYFGNTYKTPEEY